jgi:hypothetical protein
MRLVEAADMESYTIVLTRGTHVVTPAAGEAILAAMARNEQVVTVDVDMLCDGFIRTGVHLATSHIVAVIPNVSAAAGSDEIRCAPNVSALRPLRQAR